MTASLHYVRQEHPNGCAIAAIAMITGRSYREVLTVLGPDVEEMIVKPHGGMWSDCVFIALARLGYAIALEWRAQWGKPRPNWIPNPVGDVNIAEAMSGSGGHMVVVRRDGSVLDPARAGEHALSDYNINWIAAVVPLREERA